MEVAIAGAHGKIAQLLGKLLVDRGDIVWGLIRNPEHEADLQEIGVEPVLCDLEADDDVAEAVGGAEAVVFAAGAGPGSGAPRKRTMDLGGAVKLIDAAREKGIRRYLMVSAMGAAAPPAERGDVFGEYLRAKAEADEALRGSGLEYTIVRPGGLTDDEPSGRVHVGERLERGEIARADVAAVLLACLDARHTIDRSFDVVSGDTPIAEALASI
ncbi:MAG TPA: SDR family oxidoreductase [Solirubrobacterales bacterium]|nr:SDR family oxidoreductase [Solirubrobacterales bacterium]